MHACLIQVACLKESATKTGFTVVGSAIKAIKVKTFTPYLSLAKSEIERLKVNGYIFRGSNSSIFIFGSFLNRSQL